MKPSLISLTPNGIICNNICPGRPFVAILALDQPMAQLDIKL
ncbi:hypothetical protein QYZ87_08260 [Porphyromonadaceae bacterium W3.11]|nr:hypothetical protein [Porphyromonadaceae bacterium W3.11]